MLAQKGAVPADASVVVIAGPTVDLLPPEIEALKKYLEAGGKLVALVDPPAKVTDAPLTNLTAFLHEWAMDLGTNVVVDVSGVGQLIGTDESVPVAARYPSHPIVEGFRLLTAYPLARSVTPVSGGVNNRTAQTFIESSANSWGETDLAGMFASGKVENDKAKDTQGPVPIGAALSIPAPAAPAAAGGPGGSAQARRAAEAGVAAGGGGRLRLRRQLRARHPGQPRPVPEHRELGGAAGEPDLDPAEGSRRPTAHAHRLAAGGGAVARAAGRAGAHLGRGDLNWSRRRG